MKAGGSDWNQTEQYFSDIEDRTADAANPFHTYYATVREDGNGCRVVLKEIDEKRAEIFRRLCDIWNPHLASIYAVYQMQETYLDEKGAEHAKYLAIMEFVYGQMLDADNIEDSYLCTYGTRNAEQLYTLSEREALNLCIQICEGLKPLHKRKIIHGDIKPENLIIEHFPDRSPELEIIDFGIAAVYHPEKEFTTSAGGTRDFRAPESYAGKISYQSDVYSVGVILNYLLTGTIPRLGRYKKGSIAVREIIERATASEAPMRYHNISELEGLLKNTAHATFFDKIPLIRSLPGFRSHRPARCTAAAFLYLISAYVIYEEWRYATPAETGFVSVCWIIGPILFYGGAFHFRYFLPYRIRKSRLRRAMLNLAVGLLFFLIPIMYLILS